MTNDLGLLPFARLARALELCYLRAKAKRLLRYMHRPNVDINDYADFDAWVKIKRRIRELEKGN